MKKIYLSDNYVIIDLAGVLIPFPPQSEYTDNLDSFYLKSNEDEFIVGFTEVATFFNLAGDTAYTEATLRIFLRQNTGKK